MSAIIYLEQRDSGILIPKTAILEESGKYFVFVSSDDGVLSKRGIEVENIKGDDIVVKNGLKAGENILVTPDEGLKEGSKVFLQFKNSERKGAGRA